MSQSAVRDESVIPTQRLIGFGAGVDLNLLVNIKHQLV